MRLRYNPHKGDYVTEGYFGDNDIRTDYVATLLLDGLDEKTVEHNLKLAQKRKAIEEGKKLEKEINKKLAALELKKSIELKKQVEALNKKVATDARRRYIQWLKQNEKQIENEFFQTLGVPVKDGLKKAGVPFGNDAKNALLKTGMAYLNGYEDDGLGFIRMPKISPPKISPPKISLPKVNLPKINLPPVVNQISKAVGHNLRNVGNAINDVYKLSPLRVVHDVARGQSLNAVMKNWNNDLARVSKVVGQNLVDINPVATFSRLAQQVPIVKDIYRETDKFSGGLLTSLNKVSSLPARALRGDAIEKAELLEAIDIAAKGGLLIATGGSAASVIAVSSNQLKKGPLGQTELGRGLLTVGEVAGLAFVAKQSITSAIKDKAKDEAQKKVTNEVAKKTGAVGAILATAAVGAYQNPEAKFIGEVAKESEKYAKNEAVKELQKKTGVPLAMAEKMVSGEMPTQNEAQKAIVDSVKVKAADEFQSRTGLTPTTAQDIVSGKFQQDVKKGQVYSALRKTAENEAAARVAQQTGINPMDAKALVSSEVSLNKFSRSYYDKKMQEVRSVQDALQREKMANALASELAKDAGMAQAEAKKLIDSGKSLSDLQSEAINPCLAKANQQFMRRFKEKPDLTEIADNQFASSSVADFSMKTTDELQKELSVIDQRIAGSSGQVKEALIARKKFLVYELEDRKANKKYVEKFEKPVIEKRMKDIDEKRKEFDALVAKKKKLQDDILGIQHKLDTKQGNPDELNKLLNQKIAELKSLHDKQKTLENELKKSIAEADKEAQKAGVMMVSADIGVYGEKEEKQELSIGIDEQSQSKASPLIPLAIAGAVAYVALSEA